MNILKNEEFQNLAGGFECYDFDINIEIDNIIYKSIRISQESIILYEFTKKELIQEKDYLIPYGLNENNIDYYIIETLDDIKDLENMQLKKDIMEILYNKSNKTTNQKYLYSYL